jgi:hypothetical protein
MFYDGLTGSGVQDVNVRFRMYLVITVAIFALGSLLYWRSQNLIAAEYVELPDHAQKVQRQKQKVTDRFKIQDQN